MVFGNKTLQGGGVLYEFTNFTFHSGGTSGRTGPSLATLLASYDTASNPWLNNTEYFDCSTTILGTQKWKVPATGNYEITVIGARGGDPGSMQGGYGASMIGTFSLVGGTILYIITGQYNAVISNYASGGGGSAIWIEGETTPLIVAGGGGGGNDVTYALNGYNASITTTGVSSTGAGGTDGSGGTAGFAGGGAGWIGNGGVGLGTNTDCVPFLDGGTGGLGNSAPTYDGGFGGGGAGFGGGGGGGGYSGGGGGTYNNTPSTSAGGGGGSYNSGTNQTNTVSNVYSSGSVTITLL